MLTCGDDRGIHRITETLNLMEIALSIEQALKDLTEAVALNTTALNNLLSSTATVAGSPSTTSTTTASTDADDSADTTDEAPKRERGKPSPGKSKRTAAEVAEDKAADEADATAAAGDKGETADTGAVTFDSLKKELGAWLGEWAKAEDKDNPEGTHPEVGARKEAIKTLLGKLGAEKLPDIAGDATKIGKLHTWLNGSGKAGKKDKETGELVFGEGRWAADPVEDGEGGDEDDLDL